MKKLSIMLLLLSLGLQLTACLGQENTVDQQENTETTENASESEPESDAAMEIDTELETDTDIIYQELTMDVLLALCEDGTLAETAKTEGLDGFRQYENLELADKGDEASLTGLYSCSLTNSYMADTDGEEANREYELQLYYWKPETAEEYGHQKNEIDELLLMEKETNDVILLYYSGSSYASAEDLRTFLAKEYGVEQYLDISLPDGYALGNYTANLALFSGWLLEGGAEEPLHGESADASWYAPGGIGRAENASEVLVFEDGTLTEASVLMNHGGAVSESEEVKDCEVPAVLVEYEFDLFTAAEWEEYLAENPDADESESVSRYWYVFMGEEEKDTYYVLFLSEDLFSKEDAIAMARSVCFTEGAF